MSQSNGDDPPIFDAAAIRARAKALFQEHFGTCDRYRNVLPREPLDVAACEELARKGLADKVATGGPFLIGDRGVEVCMGEADLDQLLGLAPRPAPRQRLPMTMNVFQGPVGAVAAASGAVAHGTVHVGQVDEALRKTIELQDGLGDLTDTLLPLLRLARRQECTGTTEEELRAQIAEAEEFRNFEKAVKPGLPRHVAQAAAVVLELVPVLKAALLLVGDK